MRRAATGNKKVSRYGLPPFGIACLLVPEAGTPTHSAREQHMSTKEYIFARAKNWRSTQDVLPDVQLARWYVHQWWAHASVSACLLHG